MKRYRITYRESRDSESQHWFCRAYDKEHAEDRFLSQCEFEGGNEGIIIDAVTEIRRTKAGVMRLNFAGQ